VRFYRPVYPGNELVTGIFEVPADNGQGEVYAFEASSAGKVVVRDGRAEIGPAPVVTAGR
jgi:hypothetical protein